MIALLLDKSKRLGLRDEEENGSTPIDIAVEAGRQSTVRWLHDKGAHSTWGTILGGDEVCLLYMSPFDLADLE
jgi:hypothetical protein